MNQPLDRISEPLQKAGKALSRTAQGLADFIRAMVEFAAVVLTPEAINAAKKQVAVAQAPPRVRHLAQHSKKHRTRKKNTNRAMRDYQRRTRKSDRT